MRITVGEGAIGELFFSLPLPQELTKAEEEVSSHCRKMLQHKENPRLEYELAQMRKTKTAFHFLMLKEICSLSKEKGHPIMLKGEIAGSLISKLLGISYFTINELQFIAPELIWEEYKEFYTPSFEISISSEIRPLIQKRLDEKFGFAHTNDTLYYRIMMTDSCLCDEVNNADINTNNFDVKICTAVLQKIYPNQKTPACDFEQLIKYYAYHVGSFSKNVSLEELVDDSIIVTKDKLYFTLTANNVPKELAIKTVKKGLWSSENKKSEILFKLKKYTLPKSVIFSFNNAQHLWSAASCISRLQLLCQKEYISQRGHEN
ncbi:MAG: hypothetical protein IKT42_06795 [Clostridia bacterium]|nr:hypothetical protein [Clostridia bacterium]